MDGITDSGHELEQAPGDGEGLGSLACCSPCGCKESDMTERLNNNKIKLRRLLKKKKKSISKTIITSKITVSYHPDSREKNVSEKCFAYAFLKFSFLMCTL